MGDDASEQTPDGSRPRRLFLLLGGLGLALLDRALLAQVVPVQRELAGRAETFHRVVGRDRVHAPTFVRVVPAFFLLLAFGGVRCTFPAHVTDALLHLGDLEVEHVVTGRQQVSPSYLAGLLVGRSLEQLGPLGDVLASRSSVDLLLLVQGVRAGEDVAASAGCQLGTEPVDGRATLGQLLLASGLVKFADALFNHLLGLALYGQPAHQLHDLVDSLWAEQLVHQLTVVGLRPATREFLERAEHFVHRMRTGLHDFHEVVARQQLSHLCLGQISCGLAHHAPCRSLSRDEPLAQVLEHRCRPRVHRSLYERQRVACRLPQHTIHLVGQAVQIHRQSRRLALYGRRISRLREPPGKPPAVGQVCDLVAKLAHEVVHLWLGRNARIRLHQTCQVFARHHGAAVAVFFGFLLSHRAGDAGVDFVLHPVSHRVGRVHRRTTCLPVFV